jgi:tRNA(Glu) U13 pseudouridine synthase TruD
MIPTRSQMMASRARRGPSSVARLPPDYHIASSLQSARLRYTLPPGVYATALPREVMKCGATWVAD